MYSLSAMCVCAYNILQVVDIHRPRTYAPEAVSLRSQHERAVHEVVLRVFQEESHLHGYHAERIARLIEKTLEPEDAGQLSLEDLITRRLRVIAGDKEVISSTGTSEEDKEERLKGCYYITVPKLMSEPQREALSWLIAREVYHILGETSSYVHYARAAMTFASALGTYFFGVSWAPSIAAAVLVDRLVDVVCSQAAEAKADIFANRHTTDAEKRSAVAYLRSLEASESVCSWIGCEGNTSLRHRIRSVQGCIRDEQPALGAAETV